MKSKIALLGLLSSGVAFAQTATIPGTAEMTTSIGGMTTIAGLAAVLGFAVWGYRKLKSKASQAIG